MREFVGSLTESERTACKRVLEGGPNKRDWDRRWRVFAEDYLDRIEFEE